MLRKLALAGLGIGIVSLALYYWLGGFSGLTFELYESQDITIAGKEFTGRPTQQELADLFYSMRDLAAANDTSLIVVSYPKPDTTALITQFIGVPGIQSDTLETRSWKAGTFVSLQLTQNLLVTASPDKVQAEATEFAEQNGLRLSGESIEVYSNEQDTRVVYPIDR